MDLLQELQQQAEQVEVVELETESTQVSYEANRLKSSQVEASSGIAVRVVKEGRLGFSATSDVSEKEQLVENVLESATYGDAVPLNFPRPQEAPEVSTYDARIADLSIPRLVEMGQEIVDTLLAVEPEAQIKVDVERGLSAAQIRNQAGTDVHFRRSPLSILVQVARVKGDDVLILYDIQGTTVWEEEGYLSLAKRLGHKLELARESASLTSGRMPVLFSPTGALVLGLPLMMGLDGKNVYKGISPLRGKEGQTIFDSKISIVDDPTLDGRFGSAAYDDEGVPHRRNVLVENGTLRGFYYDLKTAAQAGAEPTGNGQRGLFTQPQPNPTNLLFATGATPLADMIAGIEEGLLVESALGLGQGNVISGAFSNSWSLAFKIEKGEIVGRVKDVSIAGNVYEMLQQVAAVSRESNWVYTRFNLPYILMDDVNVVAGE